MSYDYASRRVWLDDVSDRPQQLGYALCERNASRMTPPVDWSLSDRRLLAPQLPFQRVVA